MLKKHSMQALLLAFIIVLYSCKSSTKNQNKKDSTIDIHKAATKWYDKTQTKEEIDESKQDDSLRKSGDTKAIFPGYAIYLRDFKVYNGFDEKGKLTYEVDSSEVNLTHKNSLVTLICKKDTLHLTIGEYSGSDGEINALQIIPNNKDDNFKVDFSDQLTVYQNDDDFFKAGPNTDLKNFARWYGMTNFTLLSDSLNYFSKIRPGANDINFIKDDIRKKIAIRDTLVTYHRENDEEAILVYKGKPCALQREAIYYRIQRFNKGTLVDTKFIRLDLPSTD